MTGTKFSSCAIKNLVEEDQKEEKTREHERVPAERGGKKTKLFSIIPPFTFSSELETALKGGDRVYKY
jgi:hypothetical protein